MKTLIWKGIIYESLEYFNIIKDHAYFIVSSKIIGFFEDKMYCVDYQLYIDHDWNIQKFLIESEVNRTKNKLTGQKMGNEWEINPSTNNYFKGVKFIDISLTPFTNTLPINHLKMSENEYQEIEVIYIDILENHIYPVKQKYSRTGSNEYLYENIVNDFKATISVDESGLVANYPMLFEKVIEKEGPI